MTGFWADLAELIRHPRRWWHRAGHAPCPVCGQSVAVTSREWDGHQTSAHAGGPP